MCGDHFKKFSLVVRPRKREQSAEVAFSTLNSAYNEVAFNEKSAISKENLCTKCMPFTYKYIAFNEKPPITKQNLHIFFFSL